MGRREGWTFSPPNCNDEITEAGILRPKDTAMRRFASGSGRDALSGSKAGMRCRVRLRDEATEAMGTWM